MSRAKITFRGPDAGVFITGHDSNGDPYYLVRDLNFEGSIEIDTDDNNQPVSLAGWSMEELLFFTEMGTFDGVTIE